MLWKAVVDVEATVQALEKLAFNFGEERWTRLFCVGLRVVLLGWVLSIILGFLTFGRTFARKVVAFYAWVQYFATILVGWIKG